MKKLLIPVLALFLLSCAESNQAEYVWNNLEVSGEFLFEGPNTLQGKPDSPLEQISEKLGVPAEKIQKVHLSECTLEFASDSLRSQVENALVQLVSDNLELVSVATINGIPESGEISLQVSEEQDILPYLMDKSTSLVVDANTKRDMDALNCSVSFKLNVLYSN